MARRLDEADQVRAMGRAFLARFFENEITTGTDDLKTSFFWLLAFLAVPGFFMPMLMGFKWNLIALVQGPDALRLLTRGDKTLYIGFVMIATAAVAAIAWNSLLGDRRDALVLGVLPVRPVAIVAARLGALAIYMFGIGVAMNALASMTFGLNLAAHNTFGFAVRGMIAHFIATVAASACVFLWVTGAQGVVLAGLGAKVFQRVAPVMQVLLVGAIAVGFLSLPVLAGSVVGTLAGHGRSVQPWILSTPPLWFLGLYESVLGTRDPLLLHLARNAAAAVTVGAVATIVTYPIAYRRVLVAAIEEAAGNTRAPAARMVAAYVTRLIGRSSQVRAVTQFFLATIGRVEAIRFIVAATIGLVVAWVMPGWMSMASSRPESPRVLLLSISYSAMAFLVYGLNIAAALPADRKSAWMFEVTPPGRRQTRVALERTMFLFGVLPPLVVFLPLYALLWGGRFAMIHGVFMALMGMLVIELALRRTDGMPCAEPWDPEGLDLGRWWGAYLIGFILFTTKVPDYELALIDEPAGLVIFAGLTLVLILALRIRSLRRPLPDTDTSAFAPGDVLSLN
jgi:hypothetical protein